MINYELPTEIEIDGEVIPITRKGDYRVVLDIITALNDRDLNDNQKAIVCLLMFYGKIPKNTEAAIKEMMKFINCGEETDKKAKEEPAFMDWEQDFPILVAPLNKVISKEIRAIEYLHWWTFISAYMEIDGDCTFANVVKIRRKRYEGKKLDKSEKEFFRKNSDKIILKNKLSQEDIDFMNEDW